MEKLSPKQRNINDGSNEAQKGCEEDNSPDMITGLFGKQMMLNNTDSSEKTTTEYINSSIHMSIKHHQRNNFELGKKTKEQQNSDEF